MRRSAGAVLATVGLTVAAVATACGSGGAASSDPTATTAVGPALKRYAVTAAAALKVATGEDANEAAVYPPASRNTALAAIDSGSIGGDAGDSEVVTVEFRGDFHLIGVSLPYGAEPPSAAQYFVVIDSDTGQVLDAGGGPTVVDPSGELGPSVAVAI